jgi:hypothetical protein
VLGADFFEKRQCSRELADSIVGNYNSLLFFYAVKV